MVCIFNWYGAYFNSIRVLKQYVPCLNGRAYLNGMPVLIRYVPYLNGMDIVLPAVGVLFGMFIPFWYVSYLFFFSSDSIRG